MSTRILFFMATGSPVGGVSTWLDRASAELGARGYEPVVGLVRGLKYNDPDRFREYHPNLQTMDVDGRGLDREGRVLACLRTIDRVKPRLVLPLGILDANDAALRAKSRGADVRLVGRAQGNLPPMLADLQDYRDGLDHVVCVGALTRNFLIRYAGFSPDRVSHIPNGATEATREKVARKPGSPLRLGYIGRLMNDDKRVLDIVPLCHALTNRGVDFHFTIVGSGPCEAELRDKLNVFGGKVTMTGAQKAAEVYANVLPNLDVLLLFSSSETFGIVLAEAMMNGVVPVTSQYIGFQAEHLVVDGTHGLSFPVGDVEKAAEAVKRLYENPGLLSRFAKASVSHATTNYTWKRCFDLWDRNLCNILQREIVSPPRHLLITYAGKTGKLDRAGVPPALADSLRRIRRAVFGSPVPPGGEEWPLFRKNHPEERLDEIQKWCVAQEFATDVQT